MSDTDNGPPAPDDSDDTMRITTGASDPNPRAWYQKKRFLLPISAVIAFLIGSGVGSGSEDSPEGAAELADLKEQVASMEGQLDELGTQVSDIKETVKAPQAQQAGRVKELESEVASLREQVTALKKERDALEARRSEQAERIQQLESRPASAQQSPSAGGSGGGSPPSQEGSGSSAQYANCSEARAAGAAPLRRGEPGYDSSMDRDDDGVACE